MRLSDIKILLFALVAALTFTACDETEEAGEFDNWQRRNEAYIDSIAKVARANADGDWKIFLAYGLIDTLQWSNQYYVYCNVIEEGEGDEMPMFNDTVLVNYRGRLIPTKSYDLGYIFDESFTGTLDPETDVPTKLNLAGCVRGWTTAMTQMVRGDIWRVYIPSELGYGQSGQGAIPGYSTLVFDMNLIDFERIGTPIN